MSVQVVAELVSGGLAFLELEILGPPRCSACADSGLVAPDAFGEWVPWFQYLAESQRKAEAKGWPPESSAIAAGMVRSITCPECRGGRADG